MYKFCKFVKIDIKISVYLRHTHINVYFYSILPYLWDTSLNFTNVYFHIFIYNDSGKFIFMAPL